MARQLGGELIGEDALRRRLKALRSEKNIRGMVGFLSLAAVAEAKALTVPFGKTGNLGRTIRARNVTERGSEIVAGGTNSIGYAAYVEFGTGIYGPRRRKIVPVRKRMLAWQTGVGGAGGPELRLSGNRRTRSGKRLGGWAFAKSVRGRPATPYLVPGVKRALAKGGLKDALVKTWNGAA